MNTVDLDMLAAEVAALNLPVRIEDADGEVLVHLAAALDSADEAHLLNLLAHRVCRYRLDRLAGPERPLRPLPDGWQAEFAARRPEFADTLLV
jgi:hypothetical protein